MRWSVVLVAVAVFVARWVRVASACSCFTGVEPGAGRFYPKAGGVLPLDAPGIPWIADWSGKPRHKVTLERVDGDRRVLVKHRIVRREGFEFIAPRSGWRAGEMYVATVRESERNVRILAELKRTYSGEVPDPEITATFTVSDRPLQLAQTRLRAMAPEKTKVHHTWFGEGGGCSGGLGEAVAVKVAVELPPDVEPLRDYLVYETRFMGHPWRPSRNNCDKQEHGRSWMPDAGTDMVFVACEGLVPYMFARGGSERESQLRRVEVRVRSPDGAHEVITTAVDVVMDCSLAATPAVPQGAGSSAAPAVVEARLAAAPARAEEAPPVVSRGCAIDGVGAPWWFGLLLIRRRSHVR